MDTKGKIALVWQLHEQGISNRQVAKSLGLNHETVGNYVRAITQIGLLPFLDQYRAAARNPRPARQIPYSIKRKVWAIREREHGCCGQKIAYFLEKEEGVSLSVPKIYEILAEKFVLRSKWQKNRQRGDVPQAERPRQVVQMDSILFGQVFAFTAVDIFSKEADVYLAAALTAQQGSVFLQRCMTRRFTPGFVQTIQTDGGSEFEGDFARLAGQFCARHRVARPYRKNEQSFIEAFNRTVRKECLGWLTYQSHEIGALTEEVEAFLRRYHFHRPHMGLEPMRPPLAGE